MSTFRQTRPTLSPELRAALQKRLYPEQHQRILQEFSRGTPYSWIYDKVRAMLYLQALDEDDKETYELIRQQGQVSLIDLLQINYGTQNQVQQNEDGKFLHDQDQHHQHHQNFVQQSHQQNSQQNHQQDFLQDCHQDLQPKIGIHTTPFQK